MGHARDRLLRARPEWSRCLAHLTQQQKMQGVAAQPSTSASRARKELLGGVQDLLRKAQSQEDLARWSQCLARIVKHVGPMCPAAMRAAYPEICTRLMVGKPP